MKRHLVLLTAVALVVGSIAPLGPAVAKKKPKKPVPVDVTYHIVWGGEGCAISTTTDAASEEDSCADVFVGLLGDELGSGPYVMPALDGVPLTLDASKPIKGKLNVQSWYLTGEVPDVMGIGQAEVNVALTGTSAGEDLTIAEGSAEPYIVTPASADYVVEFELTPDEAMANKVFETLTLTVEVTGTQMFHGVIPADGTSTVTLGAFS